MLPKAARMRSSAEFRDAVRGGVRTARRTLVVHATSTAETDVKVGFVVSKAVGNAVTRNRVKRRLRHLCRTELAATPGGTRVVVRALPGAADHLSDLGADLPRAWGKAMARVRHRDQAGADSGGRAGT